MMDQIWSDLNKSELQVREQIRRELKDSAKDLSFPKHEIANFCTDPLTGSVQKSGAAGHQRPKDCGVIPEAKGNIA